MELVQDAFDEGKGSRDDTALSVNTLKKIKTRLQQDADPCSIVVREYYYLTWL